MEQSKSAKALKTPAILTQLKQENEELRAQLRALSGDLDKVLAKQAKKTANPTEVHGEELKIARAQATHYEKEIASMRKMLEVSSAHRVQELETEVGTLSALIREKENANRALARIQKERGDQLETMEEGKTVAKEIQSLTDTLKVRKTKLEKVESALKKEEEFSKQSRDKILDLERKVSGLQTGGEAVDIDAEPSKLPVESSDLSQIKARVALLERNREGELAKWRKKIAEAEAAFKAAFESKESALTLFQGKDQLNRIKESQRDVWAGVERQIKELKRSVHTMQRRNETMAKSTVPDMNIDPEAVANAGQEEVRETLL